jgi:hypothetical protein
MVDTKAPGAPATSVTRGLTFDVSGQSFSVPDQSPLVLVLSSGTAIFVPTGGNFTLEQFTQEPVVDTGRDREYEPTASNLSLRLTNGTFAFAERIPVPSSTLTISTPLAELSGQSRSFVLQVGADKLSIAVFEGVVKLTVPSTGFAETLQSGQYVTLQRSALAQSYPLQLANIGVVQQHDLGEWLDMARWAEARVDFARSGDKLHPRLILPVDFTTQISAEEARYQ